MSFDDERLHSQPGFPPSGTAMPPQLNTVPGLQLPRRDPFVGTSLGGYRIVEPLGGGGMGMVYKAWQETMQRMVAIKVMKPQLMMEPAVLQRFQREAITASRLNHPNIV